MRNRIRQLRDALGLTAEELGQRVGTSGVQIGRLETNKRKLTQEWMEKIAEALGCAPADLIATAGQAALSDEVEPFRPSDAVGAIDALIRRGFVTYRVLAATVAEAGIAPGAVIAVDQSEAAIAAIKTGNIVLLRIGGDDHDGPLCLRQFVAPALYVTNRRGTNIALRADDPSVVIRLVGVVLD